MKGQSELIRFLTDTRIYLSETHHNTDVVRDKPTPAAPPAEEYRGAWQAREWDPFEVWRRHIKHGA